MPGSLIWVRGGTYGTGKTVFYSRLKGTPAAPIVVRAYPGERATINGWLQIGCCDQKPEPEKGAYAWFWGLELTSSITNRTGGASGPPDFAKSELDDAVDSWAPGTRFINLIIHDTKEGIGWWSEAAEGSAYGNIIYYNGFQASDRGHGHGIYVQNKDGVKTLEDNIVFDQFGAGIHAYGSARAWVRNLVLRGNVLFNNGTISAHGKHDYNMVLGVGSGLDRIDVDSNFTYHTPSDDQGLSAIGLESRAANGTVTVENNYWIGGEQAVTITAWNKVAFFHNTLFANRKLEVGLNLRFAQNAAGYSWDKNIYYGSGQFSTDAAEVPWNTWMEMNRLDRSSTFHPGRPKGIWTFVRPNQYEKGRANIIIYDWDLKDRVPVDISHVIARGSQFEVRDAQNFFGPPVCSGLYDGKPIEIPMTGLATAVPNGAVPAPPKHTAPEFGVFVLLPRYSHASNRG